MPMTFWLQINCGPRDFCMYAQSHMYKHRKNFNPVLFRSFWSGPKLAKNKLWPKLAKNKLWPKLAKNKLWPKFPGLQYFLQDFLFSSKSDYRIHRDKHAKDKSHAEPNIYLLINFFRHLNSLQKDVCHFIKNGLTKQEPKPVDKDHHKALEGHMFSVTNSNSSALSCKNDIYIESCHWAHTCTIAHNSTDDF